MIEVECITKQWGKSSLACIIPKEIVRQRHLKPNRKIRLILEDKSAVLEQTFGILKNWKKPTQKIMAEIDEELWVN